MMVRGDDIKSLIPQRNPMMMVDEFEAVDENNATTALAIRTDNIFVSGLGEMPETGLIEHMAQSASALAGWNHARLGATNAPVGIIGEVKHFSCNRRPKTGEVVHTAIRFGLSFGNVTLAHGITSLDNEVIAEADLKIFIQS